MRKFLNALIVIPLALVFIVFAVANRQFVRVSFDPMRRCSMLTPRCGWSIKR